MKQKIANKDEILECNLNTVLGAVRGSSGYWNRVCGDLNVMDENFGPATFFCSFAIAEYGWVDLHDFLKILNPDLKSKNLNELCKVDPVGVSMFFENKFQSFLHTVILNEHGPLGKVFKIINITLFPCNDQQTQKALSFSMLIIFGISRICH